MQQKLIIGNWKMNGNANSWRLLINSIVKQEEQAISTLIVCPPQSALSIVGGEIATAASKIILGAQDVHYKESGAYTGDTSAEMLKSLGVKYSIVGHSERRDYHKESSTDISLKAVQCIKNDIVPIVCIGESLNQYERGVTLCTLDTQLEESLHNINLQNPQQIIIAYEPIWAIGTGKTVSPKHIKNVYKFLRTYLVDKYKDLGYEITLIYGGSVTPSNIEQYLQEQNIGGFLVGGASLDAETFLELAKKSVNKI